MCFYLYREYMCLIPLNYNVIGPSKPAAMNINTINIIVIVHTILPVLFICLIFIFIYTVNILQI